MKERMHDSSKYLTEVFKPWLENTFSGVLASAMGYIFPQAIDKYVLA